MNPRILPLLDFFNKTKDFFVYWNSVFRNGPVTAGEGHEVKRLVMGVYLACEITLQ